MGNSQPVCTALSVVAIGALLLVTFASSSMAATKNTELSLKEAINLALKPTPGLSSMQARADAKAHLAEQSGALPDPRISFNLANFPTNSFSRDQEAMTQIQLGLSQDIPFPGKLSLKEQADTADAKASGEDVDEYRLNLVRDVKILWWQIFFIDRSLETVTQNQNLINQLVATAQTKYAVGKGLQQDILLAELELSKLADMKLTLTDHRQNAVFKLNSLLARDIQTAVFLPSKVDTTLIQPKPLSVLLETAREHRPLLRASQLKIDAANSRFHLAQKEIYPDFRLGALYGQRSGRDDLASLQLSMSVPIYAGSKQFRTKDQRQAELLASRFNLEDTQLKISADISSALSRYQQSAKQIKLFEDSIIPQARQTIESMLAAYQVNNVDFLNVIRSQTTLFDYLARYWNAFSNAQQALATLEAIVGQENIYE